MALDKFITLSYAVGSVAFSYCYAECHYAECRHAGCHYTDCRAAVFKCLQSDSNPRSQDYESGVLPLCWPFLKKQFKLISHCSVRQYTDCHYSVYVSMHIVTILCVRIQIVTIEIVMMLIITMLTVTMQNDI